MANNRSFAVSVLLTACLLCWSVFAQAHPPGLSSVDISLSAETVEVKATFALQDIEASVPMDADLDAEVSDAERTAAKPAIAKLISEKLQIRIDESLLQPIGEGAVDFDDQNNAHVQWQLQSHTGKQLKLQSGLLMSLAEGHQQYLTVRWQGGNVLAEKLLSQQQAGYELAIDPDAQSPVSSFSDFFKLGIEHILTGYDHLLFLLGLLAVTHRFWPALKIITFFTIAHSITLACAGLKLFSLPSSFVEPFIAATIVYVGVENLIRGDQPKARQWLTFAFGLVHGFGFAGVLQEFDIASSSGGILLPLLSFNLGIESGQIAVASLVLPVIWWLNNQAVIAPWFLKTCSTLVSLMGLYWFVERTLL